MRKLLMSVAAAAMLATAGPALAQIGFHGPGVDVQIGPERPYYRDYRVYREEPGYYAYGWRDRRCRTVTVRERTWDGRVIVRTRERC